MNSTNLPPQRTNMQSHWVILLASIITATVYNLIGLAGIASSTDYGYLQSTDDLVRMVTVRDWIAGQSWFDPVLHKLGYEPGTVMHWSRLIDAPIRFLVGLGNLFVSGSGERFAAFVWPFVTLVAAYAAILTAVRRITGSENLTTTAIIGGFSLWSWATFQSGAIDHHNVQAVLALWLVVSVLPSKNDPLNLTIAGIATSVSMAIGIEALPIAVAGALAVWLRLVVEREAFYAAAQRYGLSLAISIAILFFGLIGPEYYAKTYCDSLSQFHLVCTGLGGLLLYIGLKPRLRGFVPMAYFSVPILTGATVVLTAYLRFPHCLADPTAIDPLLQHYWLDYIVEAQNIYQLATGKEPLQLIYIYAMPLIAIAFATRKIASKEKPLLAGILLIFLVITLLVTLFQIRGVKQLVPIGGLTLSIFMTQYMEAGGKIRPLRALTGLLVCCNLFWGVVTATAMAVVGIGASDSETGAGTDSKSLCRAQSDLDAVLAEKAGFIAGANGLGPWLLFNTNHRVLAGPYHRNTNGNVDAVKIMIGSEAEAKAIIFKGGITHFMACPKFPDEAQILKEAPNGFLGQLLGGKTPDWLEPVQSTMDGPLKLWRVRG
ncbi:MAG: hypothetical protein ACRCU5_15540 [Rhizobiaceae bacterium]